MNFNRNSDPLRRGLRSQSRHAYSLLEVALASSLCATAIVPALALMRDGMKNMITIDTDHMLLLYGIEKMEEQQAICARSWTTGNASGNFSADGNSNIRYSVTRSDSSVSGGITNRLMVISVTTFYDTNGNSAMDTGESRLTFTTKVAKLATYQAL
ncbi:MAG TPA: hypothetical protein VGM76_13355 [Lacipirellulaceae bacterium]